MTTPQVLVWDRLRELRRSCRQPRLPASVADVVKHVGLRTLEGVLKPQTYPMELMECAAQLHCLCNLPGPRMTMEVGEAWFTLLAWLASDAIRSDVPPDTDK